MVTCCGLALKAGAGRGSGFGVRARVLLRKIVIRPRNLRCALRGRCCLRCAPVQQRIAAFDVFQGVEHGVGLELVALGTAGLGYAEQFAQVQKVALRALFFVECVGRAGHASGRAPFGDEVLGGHGVLSSRAAACRVRFQFPAFGAFRWHGVAIARCAGKRLCRGGADGRFDRSLQWRG